MSDIFDWDDLKLFLAVARRGSLGAAGRNQRQSQPTVGRRIKALETALGRTLFQRTPRGLVLTEEGARLLGRAERIEEETLGIQRQLSAGDLQGMLRVGSSEWFGSHVVASLLAEFLRAHPGVTAELLTDYRVRSLNRRELDVAFRIVPFDEPDVIARRLLTTRYGVYMAQNHAAPAVGDGTGAGLITLTPQFDHLPDGAWLRRMLPNAAVVLRSNNREVQAKFCAEGGGIAVLPLPLAESFPDLVRLDWGEEPPTRDTWLGYHRDQGDSPLIRAFVDLAVARLAR
jgi:DNA-binding transcriptional LysR family regulator